MALDERKRQKRLSRKNAKRRAKHPSRTASASAASVSLTDSPVLDCLVPEGLFAAGIGNILISRRRPDGKIGLCVFLLDVFCLGIKDAFLLGMSDDEYDSKIAEIRNGADFRSVEASYVRKLIESAEAYAEDLGFSPAPNYHIAKKYLAGIDAGDCREHFEFGRDGKPLFISGPNDSQARCMKIIETLTRRCGPGGFAYMIGVNQGV